MSDGAGRNKMNKIRKQIQGPVVQKENSDWAGIVSTVNYFYKLSTRFLLFIVLLVLFVGYVEQSGARNYLTRTCAILVVNLPNPFD